MEFSLTVMGTNYLTKCMLSFICWLKQVLIRNSMQYNAHLSSEKLKWDFQTWSAAQFDISTHDVNTHTNYFLVLHYITRWGPMNGEKFQTALWLAGSELRHPHSASGFPGGKLVGICVKNNKNEVSYYI